MLAESKNEVVGYLAGSINESGAYSYYEGKTAELENMFIRAEFRKYGEGSKLISEFENWRCGYYDQGRPLLHSTADD